MAHFFTAVVTAVVSERPGIQRIDLEGTSAVVLTEVVGPVAVGDEVVVNATGRHWGLGSSEGGIVHWNLARRSFTSPSAPPPGDPVLVKARYTGSQVATTGADEGGEVNPDCAGVPVVACHLHSQLEAVAVAFSRRSSGGPLGLVMTDTACLPLALSDTVARLRTAGLLTTTVTAGQAFGAEHEAVSVASALQVAVAAGVTAVVVAPGPGVVGSASRYGFGGMEIPGVAVAATALGAIPILAVRASSADSRDRHRGVSHHTRTVLEACPVPMTVALPAGADGDFVGHPHLIRHCQVADLVGHLDPAATTMGRGPAEDPDFFDYSLAAGAAAAALLG